MNGYMNTASIPTTTFLLPRPTLAERMKNYYYDSTTHVWDSWTDSELKAWLVEHNIIKSDAQIKREKLQKLVG